jgi:hypothetical protein
MQSNLAEIIDRAFQDDGKTVIDVAKLRELTHEPTRSDVRVPKA